MHYAYTNTIFKVYLCRERERDLLRLDLDLDLERECLRLLSFLPGKQMWITFISALEQTQGKTFVLGAHRLTTGLNRSRDEGLRLSDSLHGFLDFLVGSVCLQTHACRHRVHPVTMHWRQTCVEIKVTRLHVYFVCWSTTSKSDLLWIHWGHQLQNLIGRERLLKNK